MLRHRQSEVSYYEKLLGEVAEAANLELELHPNPHRFEGMADIAVVGDRVILTHTVKGRYDEGLEPKTMRSSKEGVMFAADRHDIEPDHRLYVELCYPHFHGDTVHFGARPQNRGPCLVHYSGGLYGSDAEKLANWLSKDMLVSVDREDAVTFYASNSRQVEAGVLMPQNVTEVFETSMKNLGLETQRLPLEELFGKAGGGPACTTLYLPKNLEIPENFPAAIASRDRHFWRGEHELQK